MIIQARPAVYLAISSLMLLVLVWTAQVNRQDDLTEDYVATEAVSSRATPARTVNGVHPRRGDLEQIRKSRQLRILLPADSTGLVIHPREQQLLMDFAAALDLTPVWIKAKDEWERLTALADGRGDIISSPAVKSGRTLDGVVKTTIPWAISKQQVISRKGSSIVNSYEDLSVRQLAIRRSSPAWQILASQAEQNLGMELIAIPDTMDIMSVLRKVSSSQYDLAVVDSLDLNDHVLQDHGLEVVMDLSDESPMNWSVRHGATALHQSLQRFLHGRHLENVVSRSYREDLPKLKQRKLLRLITVRSPVNYFYEHGRLKGFEYELIKRFADNHGLRVDVVIADTQQEMHDKLLKGKGDVIAASLPENRYNQLPGIRTSTAYNFSSPTLVGKSDEAIADLRDLQGRVIYLPAESPYRASLQRISDLGIDFTIVDPGPGANTETVLFRVSQGLYDLTVIGSHQVNAEFTRQLGLEAHFAMSDPQALAWAVRDTDTLLLSALNSFIDKEYRKGFYNVVYSRYIENPRPAIADSSLLAGVDSLSPYDDIVHEYAEEFRFDWRLIVAQMYQESNFNPGAVSSMGAAGLMQLLPGTAEMMGVREIYNPASNIYGGIRYLDYLRGLFEEELDLEDRTWFMLASYNAGYNRIKRARDMAEEMNLDRNRWFNNVELAMLRLGKPYLKDGEMTQECRCGQTVVYVREIKTLYNNYLQLTQSVRTTAQVSPVLEES